MGSECGRLRPDQTLFTYLHLAADRPQAEALLRSGAICIAYETVTDERGGLPLLRPMSEVAGRMSVQVGAHYLEKAQGGRGVLMGGVPGVAPAKVAILGGGVSGVHAAEMALGLRADVTIFDISTSRLAELDRQFAGAARTAFASRRAIAAAVAEADLVIGAVLVPGAAAPKLITREMLKTMRRGAVLVDVAIDQGGCFEASRPTTHDDPVFVEDGVLHYCVANMPGAVAHQHAGAQQRHLAVRDRHRRPGRRTRHGGRPAPRARAEHLQGRGPPSGGGRSAGPGAAGAAWST